ncbi:hypothetical protein GCM10022221_05980 [Actinocorallia aurea]
MSGWDEYATVLGEVLRTAPADTEVFLRAPGGRHLALHKRPTRWAVHLSSRAYGTDGAAEGLGWVGTPQGYALPPPDPADAVTGLVGTAVRTLREILLVGVPGEVTATARRTGGPAPDLAALRFPLPPAAELDTAGWRRDPRSPFWTDERTGARVLFQPVAKPPPGPWDDLPALRRALARDHATAGCLISADPVTVADEAGLAHLAKVTHAGSPGVSYVLTVWFLRSTRAVCVQHLIDAPPAPDPRSSAPSPHPYDPALTTALPYLPSDEKSLDASYPDHPLTLSRVWLHSLPLRLKFDPSFAASPR